MMVKKIGMFILLGITALFIVGCSSSASSGVKGESNGTDTSSKEIPSYTGGDLHIALNSQPGKLDPHVSTTTDTRDVARPIFETLVTLNSKFEVEPMLAEKYEVSDDGLEFTFYLRKGVKFHNGKEMKAEDVVASLMRWVEKSGRAKNTIGDGKFEEIDEYTVKLVLPQTSVGALHILGAPMQFGAIMPKEVIESASPEEVNEYIGTGPFKFVEWKQDQYIKYEKYDEYQSPEGTPDGLAGKREALVDNLYFDFITDSSTRVSGITTGQYDIGIMMPLDSFDQLENTATVKNVTALASGVGIIFNEKEGLLSNQKMRLALNMGLNYEELLIGGYTSSEFYRLTPSLMYQEQKDWYTDAGKENYNPNNPEQSKKMFKEAGYNGETVKILTTREFDYMYNTAVVLQAQLKEIGVKAELNVVDWATKLNLREDPANWDVFISSFSGPADPTQHLFFDPKYAGWNEDEKKAELLTKIRSSRTPADAFPYWEELQEYTWTTQLPLIRLGDTYNLFSYHENVVGFREFEGVIPWNVGKK